MKVAGLPCYYCGQPATDSEHVIEKSVLRSLRSVSQDLADQVIGSRKLMVPSCRECNSLLVGTVQFTLSERKQFVKFKIRQKYHQQLMMPEWTEEQLERMGRHLRSHIVRGINLKKRIEERLSW